MNDVEVSPPPTPRAPRRRPWLFVVVALAAVLALLAIVVSQCSSGGGGSATPTPTTLDAPTVTAINGAVSKAVEAQSQIVAKVYQRIQPSVVEIDVQQQGAPTTASDGSGLGTGVVVNGDGSILTAFHVVQNATSINIAYPDGTRTTAQIASADPQHDIATLTPAKLPSVVVPAVLGGAGVAVGLPVIAVGNPLGLDDTTTAGVISALNRSIRAEDGTSRDGLIQFDAAVNPGSSGGPLLNQQGEVIGIVVAIADPSKDGFFIGISFAVPIGTALAAGGGPQPSK